jgi:hypothetical protein
MTQQHNYRDDILSIASRFTVAGGTDWERSLLEGAPDFIDADEALRIATWWEDAAPSTFIDTDDEVWDAIASAIRDAVEAIEGRRH